MWLLFCLRQCLPACGDGLEVPYTVGRATRVLWRRGGFERAGRGEFLSLCKMIPITSKNQPTWHAFLLVHNKVIIDSDEKTPSESLKPRLPPRRPRHGSPTTGQRARARAIAPRDGTGECSGATRRSRATPWSEARSRRRRRCWRWRCYCASRATRAPCPCETSCTRARARARTRARARARARPRTHAASSAGGRGWRGRSRTSGAAGSRPGARTHACTTRKAHTRALASTRCATQGA